MAKGLLNLLTYSGLAAILLFSWQCKPETDLRTKEVKEYLKARYNIKPDEKTGRIYMINDVGCGNCILSLSEFVKQHVNDDKALIIINSRGSHVDLDAFEGKKKKNPHIIINHQVITDESDLFYHSGVVYMTEEKVDTIVKLDGDDIATQLQYIFAREKGD